VRPEGLCHKVFERYANGRTNNNPRNQISTIKVECILSSETFPRVLMSEDRSVAWVWAKEESARKLRHSGPVRSSVFFYLSTDLLGSTGSS
jgi:hypothetical protein